MTDKLNNADYQEVLDRKRKEVQRRRSYCMQPDANPLIRGDWFPRSVYESVNLQWNHGEDYTGRTYAAVDNGRFYMVNSWHEYDWNAGDDSGISIIWLDSENTTKMQSEFDTDFFADLYARFGSDDTDRHYPWGEVADFLNRKGIAYSEIEGRTQLGRGATLDEEIEALQAERKE